MAILKSELPLKSKYPIGSTLTTIISLKEQDKIILICTPEEKIVRISSRCQSKRADMGELMNKSVKDIPNAVGGGHAPAAGARVPKEYFSQFKNNVLNNLPDVR